MTLSPVTGWTPSLSSNLQKELSTLENSQTSLVASSVSAAANSIYQTTITQAATIVGNESVVNQEVGNLQQLVSALNTLQQAIQTLGSAKTWNAVTASSSNSSALQITASSGAPQTSVSFTVNSYAQNQISLLNVSSSSADASTSITSGNIVLTGGLGSATVSVQSGDSLNTIAADINTVSSQTGVQASVMQNGSSYQLMLTGSATGQSQAFSLGTGTTATVGGTSLSQTVIQQASDASLTLGGANGITSTSSTNTFSNLIPNTTITVQSGAASNSGTITVTPNQGAITNAANSFFDAYNAVEKLVYTGGAAADTQVGQMIAAQLPATVSRQVVSAGDPLQSLSQIGIITSPGSYTVSDGSFSSNGAPSIGFELSSGVAGTTLPAGVTMPDGKTTFQDLLTSQNANVQNLLGVTPTGSNLPSSSVLGNLNAQVKVWLQDLNGTTEGSTRIPGQIQTLQSQIGSSASPLPGTFTYALNQLQTQYTSQMQNIITQWNFAESAMLQAQQQYSQLSAIQSLTQSSTFQTGMMLGG